MVKVVRTDLVEQGKVLKSWRMKDIRCKLPSYADKIMSALDQLEERNFIFSDRQFDMRLIADEVNTDLCEIRIWTSCHNEARMYMIDDTGCMQIIIYGEEDKKLSVCRNVEDDNMYAAFCDAISMLITMEELN